MAWLIGLCVYIALCVSVTFICCHAFALGKKGRV